MMVFLNDESEAKLCIVNMLDEVTFGQAEALSKALEIWDEYDKLRVEYDFIKECVCDNGFEWDLLSKYINKKGE